MAAKAVGRYQPTASRDTEGQRIYKVKYLVETDSADEGPATVLRATGLPQKGEQWAFGSDVDEWAYCQWDAEVAPHVVTDEPTTLWEVSLTFSSKPPATNRCQDEQVSDPLLQPPKISGSFIKSTEEKTEDRFGNPIRNSAHEMIRGPKVEFDDSRPQIKIEQNIPDINLPLLYSMRNTLNSVPMWGLPPRSILLSEVSFQRLYYGQCMVYYTRSLTFDVKVKTVPVPLANISDYEVIPGLSFFTGVGSPTFAIGLVGDWERDILDEGGKVLHGELDATTGTWTTLNFPDGTVPDPKNPAHFIRYLDSQGHPMRVILNGAGIPATTVLDTSKRLISIQDANTAHAQDDRAWWMPVFGFYSFDDLANWGEVGAVYNPGELVLGVIGTGFEDTLYISTVYNNLEEPPGAGWVELGQIPVVPQYEGNYSNVSSYSKGDIVTSTFETDAGRIHIEAYKESDFTLL